MVRELNNRLIGQIPSILHVVSSCSLGKAYQTLQPSDTKIRQFANERNKSFFIVPKHTDSQKIGNNVLSF